MHLLPVPSFRMFPFRYDCDPTCLGLHGLH